jgi:hypothetical protein
MKIKQLLTLLKPEKIYVAKTCLHKTKLKGNFTVFGETGWIKMLLNDQGNVDYCIECLAAMTTRCAWCQKPIFVGDLITFQLPVPSLVSKNERINVRKPREYVGCLRVGCATTGANRNGFWMPGHDGKGRVMQVPSSAEIALREKKMVYIPDLNVCADAARFIIEW